MFSDTKTFLDRLFAAVHADGIDVSALELDHLCYRVASEQRFTEMKALLHAESDLLAESMIGGRPIATFRLHAPIHYRDRAIDVIELPAPKPASPYPEGYEHAEFVVHEDLRVFASQHPALTWDLSDLNEPINADVRLRYAGFSVKFHRQPLAYVIEHLDPK